MICINDLYHSSTVRVGGTALSNRVLVAAGGGGGGIKSSCRFPQGVPNAAGGNGSYPNGLDAPRCISNVGTVEGGGGFGATQEAGGEGVPLSPSGDVSVEAGVLGRGSDSQSQTGGGGGGGYYGKNFLQVVNRSWY